ncbi:unnamed protein product [Fusarium equiseti]|uniref:Uncharacterized protein n=1 Tax=Fusarium equiseti TaxID=61235 RepID=A0A8J2IF53_FUSEQ|nr:unnamed protein product [Fusarium equiseti]
MAGDTGSDGGFCCGLPNPFKAFKKKIEEPGPIRQAKNAGCIDRPRNPIRIDDQGRPIDSQDQPTQVVRPCPNSAPDNVFNMGRPAKDPGALFSTSWTIEKNGHAQDCLGNELFRYKDSKSQSQLATPVGLGGQVIPLDNLAPASAGGPSATGPSGGGPPTGASGAGSSSVDSKGKGNDVAEKEDVGDGNLTAAANLI